MQLDVFTGYRQESRWQNPIVQDTFSVLFRVTENKEQYLVVCRDKDGRSPTVAELMHATLVLYLDMHSERAQADGLRPGAQNITKALSVDDYSDAHNPLLWRRAMIVEGKPFSPYTREYFSSIGICSHSESLVWKAMVDSDNTNGLHALLQTLFHRVGNGMTYVDFIRSHWMSSHGKK